MNTSSKATQSGESPPQRLSVSLTGAASQSVSELSEALGLSTGAVVRRAVGLLSSVVEAEQNGAKVMMKDDEGEYLIKFIYGG